MYASDCCLRALVLGDKHFIVDEKVGDGRAGLTPGFRSGDVDGELKRVVFVSLRAALCFALCSSFKCSAIRNRCARERMTREPVDSRKRSLYAAIVLVSSAVKEEPASSAPRTLGLCMSFRDRPAKVFCGEAGLFASETMVRRGRVCTV